MVLAGSGSSRRAASTGPAEDFPGIVDGGAPRPGDHVRPSRKDTRLPGLLNAHDHLPLNALPEVPDLGTFGNAATGSTPFDRSSTPSVPCGAAIDLEVARATGAEEPPRGAVTTVAHHDPWLDPMGGADFPVRVLSPYGWCHSPRLAGRYGPGLEESHAMTPAGARWFIHLAEGTDGEPGAR